jgi:hypothetical protein
MEFKRIELIKWKDEVPLPNPARKKIGKTQKEMISHINSPHISVVQMELLPQTVEVHHVDLLLQQQPPKTLEHDYVDAQLLVGR